MKTNKNKKGRYAVGIILLAALCVFGVFITAKGLGKNKIGRAKNIELGLDLAEESALPMKWTAKMYLIKTLTIRYISCRSVWKDTVQNPKSTVRVKTESTSRSRV